jgi:hypothetical protein
LSAYYAIKWPLGRHTLQTQHKTLQERITVAKNFIARFNYKIPMLVDSMDDKFTFVYKSHPERLFVFSPQGKMMWKSFPKDALMRYEDLTSYLDTLP